MADLMQQAPELLPCPFCGGEATMRMIGNVHSTRKCVVKCSGCRYERTDAVLRYGDEWLLKTAIAAWNRRTALRAAPEVPKHAEFYLGQDCFVICDWEDYELVRGYLWKATTLQSGGTRYAQAWQYSREGARKRVSMHRLILNADSDSVIDHINGNGLDNRRSNLRIATRQQNSFNQRGTSTKSPYKGTFFEKSSGLWRASICVNGKKISGGRHQSIIDAAKAGNVVVHGDATPIVGLK